MIMAAHGLRRWVYLAAMLVMAADLFVTAWGNQLQSRAQAAQFNGPSVTLLTPAQAP